MADNFVIGEVLSVNGDRITVRAEGLPVEPDSLYVNPMLLSGYDPKLAGELKGKFMAEDDVTTEVESGDLTAGAGQLAAGDRVVLLTPDHQRYYLICKAVMVRG